MNVFLPRSVEEACDLLAAHEGAIPVAGGTDLFVHWPLRLEEHGRTYVDLSGVADLRPHRWTDTELVLGALTTYWDVIADPRAAAELPLLAEAARRIGAIQIQARGTWAGNIVNASPAADGVPVLMAYDASVVLRSSAGIETIRLADFYLGYRSTRRRLDQLVVEIRVPRDEYDFQLFEKVGPRAAQAITKVGVAVTRKERTWKVVANAVAPTVCRCRTTEAFLAARQRVRRPDDLLGPLRADVSPIDDIRSTARYREQVLTRLLYYGLRDVCPWFA